MEEGVHVEVAEGDSCTGLIAANGGVWVSEDPLFIVEDGFEEVVLEVDTGEMFAVLTFDGEVLPMIVGAVGGEVSRTRERGEGRRTLRAAWVGLVVAAERKRGKMMA